MPQYIEYFQVAREECRDVPRQVCNNVPKQVEKQQCTKIPRENCIQVKNLKKDIFPIASFLKFLVLSPGTKTAV